MKLNFKTPVLLALGIAIGFGFNSYVMSDVPSKIAVVDVNKVVANSAQVNALKKEQSAKMNELQTWLNKVRADVKKQKSQQAQQALIKKYDAEFVKKQDAIRKSYGAKLQAIDKNISGVIAAQAKAQGYDIVLSKSIVLYGGKDITASVATKVK